LQTRVVTLVPQPFAALQVPNVVTSDDPLHVVASAAAQFFETVVCPQVSVFASQVGACVV
jgi:hypothetical protein